MTEEKIINRGWVKNAAIIFLAVMLVLTFLSNTIMNHSLPEVATKWVESGTINTRIRGQAVITAVETYEVKPSGSVRVDGVHIKAGDQVAVGDLLFTFSGGEGTELYDAEHLLDDLELDYRRALITATDFDYTKENRDILNIRDDLDEAILKRDSLKVSEEEYAAAKKAADDAKNAVTVAQTKVDDCQSDVTEAQKKLDSVSQGGGDYSAVSAAKVAWEAAKADLSDAENELETARILYGAKYDQLKAEAVEMIKASDGYRELDGKGYTPEELVKEREKYIDAKLPVFLPAAADKYKAEDSDGKYEAYTQITKKETALKAAQLAEKNAKYDYDAANDDYSDANSDNSRYNKYKKELDAANSELSSAEKELTKAENTKLSADEKLGELETQREDWKTADENVRMLEDSLSDKIFELEQQQKSDHKSSELEKLDLESKRKDVEEQRELVKKLSVGGSADEIRSKVDGIVSEVSITSGNLADSETVLAVIDVPGRGYQAEMPVTNEQAKRVSIGARAEVSYGWGGLDINATLRNIKPDPQKPRQGKLLVFDVSGSDIESGAEMTFSVGEKSKSYETIVPNSAVRSDSNGSFVLVITAKSTPLGNRYKATRVDVEVLNSDDVNSAVSGGITMSDYVITTSTAPVENGQLVRMADNQL